MSIRPILPIAASLAFAAAATAAPEVTAVSASAAQEGNPAAHAIDADPGTRWSAQGDGQWIALELSEPAEVGAVELGFRSGERRYRFAVEVSSDGGGWQKAGEFTSGGGGEAVERFALPKPATARFVRVVSHGSNANDWVNLHTLRLPGVKSDAAQAKVAAAGQAGGLIAGEWAPPGMVGSVVGVSVDLQGRVFATHTWRRNNGAIDIRKNRGWLTETLSSQSVEDKRKLIRSRMPNWESLFQWKEKVLRLADTDGDGKADERAVFYEGFNSEVHGLAGGVLWYGGSAYVTCIPGFYRLPDADADGRADAAEEIAHGFGIHVGYGGHDMHGPTLGPDGRIYWSIGDKAVSVTRNEDGKKFHYPAQGAVMRIEPDGTGFEVFAHGLRNPQELAFDEFGNLFTVDNDGDFGDKERFVFIVEGSDSGWRAHHQYRGKGEYNMWIDEKLWQPALDTHPAYLLPPLSNYSSGPIGFTYNPGTALGADFAKTFLLAESNKQLSAFRAEPAGAGFRMADARVEIRGPFITGISFGPDGALYAADWGNNEWAPHENGRILRIDVAEAKRDPRRAETQGLLAAGLANFDLGDLVGLLGHDDQRVRINAQVELQSRGTEGIAALNQVLKDPSASLLARLHAIWGVGQAARRKGEDAAGAVVALLGDRDPQIRAQAAKVLGDARARVPDAVAGLLADPEPVVRLHAGIALGKIGAPRHAAAAVAMLAKNAGADRELRHAGIAALTGCCAADRAPLAALARHESREVRLAAVVALRRLGDEAVSLFLGDADPAVVEEAARAIHDDASIPAALPALAARLGASAPDADGFVRRAISANLRVGGEASARRLAAFAADGAHAPAMRAEALASLATWAKTEPLDRVQGAYRGSEERDLAPAHAALDAHIAALLAATEKPVRDALAKAIKQLNYGNAADRMAGIALDGSQPADARAAALEALAALGSPKLPAAIEAALGADSPLLRMAGIDAQFARAPGDPAMLAAVARALASADTAEAQHAMRALGKVGGAKAEAMLGEKLGEFESGALAADLRLDALLAAKASPSPALNERAAAIEAKLPPADGMPGIYALAGSGGDPAAGADIFRTHIAAQCSRCHRIGKTGDPADMSDVGPNLAGVATRRDAAYLLRALLNPSADIDPAFRMQLVTKTNGEVVAGAVLNEGSDFIEIGLGAGEPQRIAKSAIAKQEPQNVSIMPPMAGILSPAEVRDVLAFLKMLK